jgi:hypothetical protein
MRIKKYFSLLLLSAFAHTGFAQQVLTGKIVRKESTEIIPGVNVYNLSQKKRNISDMGGNYKIVAAPGDTIIFSSAGYLPDSLVVQYSMFAKDRRISLLPNVTTLAGVTVTDLGIYQADSANRHNDYAFLLDKKHPVKLMNEKREGDAPGFNFSPIGYFSKKEKDKRRLKKRLAQQEEDHFIDYKFPASRVAQLTGLKGEALRQFMIRYRPSYKFCRKASNQDMFQYINEKFKLFRESQKSP